MKNALVFLIVILACDSYAQTLYVPSSTSGIGASSIANSVGIGTASPRGQFDVAGTGDIFLAGNPNLGSAQSIYLPGHIFFHPMRELIGLIYKLGDSTIQDQLICNLELGTQDHSLMRWSLPL